MNSTRKRRRHFVRLLARWIAWLEYRRYRQNETSVVRNYPKYHDALLQIATVSPISTAIDYRFMRNTARNALGMMRTDITRKEIKKWLFR